MTMKIAVLGTRGIPAKYGGFETFADEISTRLVQEGFEVTVFCEAAEVQPAKYRGVNLRYAASPKLGALSTITYDLICLWLARKGFDVVYMLGYGASVFCFIPRLWGTEVWINMDGLEWQRKKWDLAARSYLHVMEGIATWMPDRIIADAQAIRVDLRRRYAARIPCDVIPYGCEILKEAPELTALNERNLVAGEYYLVVCRFEPENHVAEIIEGFLSSNTKRSLVLVGNNQSSTSYVTGLVAHKDERVRFIGTVYDRAQLRSLRFHCRAFFHGYSVGGTPLSLLEAMGCANLVVAHDNRFNREVLEDVGLYFTNASDLGRIVADIDAGTVHEQTLKQAARARASTYYNWPLITATYKNLLTSAHSSRHDGTDFAPRQRAELHWSRSNVASVEEKRGNDLLSPEGRGG